MTRAELFPENTDFGTPPITWAEFEGNLLPDLEKVGASHSVEVTEQGKVVNINFGGVVYKFKLDLKKETVSSLPPDNYSEIIASEVEKKTKDFMRILKDALDPSLIEND